jgi:1-acyl-sn-glycerol-3-phosphate acyltransferase
VEVAHLWHTNRVRTLYPGDSYRTPEGAAKPFLRFLSRLWRWFFYLQYFGEVIYSKGLADKGAYDTEEWAESSLRVVRIIERNGGRFEITGIDRLRRAADEGPFVFISNHMSTLETQVLPSLIAPFMPATFVVKESLTTHPFFGSVMRSRDPIAVKRKNPREDLETVLREGQARLARGMSVIIFPQSTRTPVFSRESFNTLGIKLALAAGVRVFPIAVKSDFWGEKGIARGFGPIRPSRTIHITFGEPMPVEGRGKREHQQIVEFIEGKLAEWGAPRQSGE